MDRSDIDRIALTLMAEHGAHTAILYGSWARGDATVDSDIDYLFVRGDGTGDGRSERDARVLDGVYIDGFVYAESALVELDPSFLRLLGGKVIVERDGFGTTLLERVRELYERGPTPMPDDERRATIVWSTKMLDRIRNGSGLDASYRRMQLATQALDDYFVLRGRWFGGHKQAFAWLATNDPATLALFERVTEPAADEAFVDLVRVVYGA